MKGEVARPDKSEQGEDEITRLPLKETLYSLGVLA